MVGQMLNQNTPRYPANFAYQNPLFIPAMSLRFNFQSNQGNPSSRELYYNPQSSQSNSNDAIISKGEKIYSSLDAGKNKTVMIYYFVRIINFIKKDLYFIQNSGIFYLKDNHG